MRLKLIFIIIFSLEVSAQILPQDSIKIELKNYNMLQPEVNYTSLGLVGASSVTAALILHNYQYQSWWKNNSSNFSFNNSFDKNSLINKAGKFYSTNLIAHFYSASLEGSGVNYEKAAIYSAAIGFAYGLYVETYDGFTRNEGFNTSDIMFNAIGAGYVLGQYYFPVLKNFQPRFSYYPSKEYSNNEIKNKNIFSDYGGQKFWMGIRVKEFLPGKIKKFWPSFLMVSIGAGVNKYQNNKYLQNELFIALDIDAEEIPLYGDFWQFVKNTFNYFHFPLPGIRISPDATAFLFCY